jgi:choice-of-anchor A domain-containing protein
MNTSGHVWLSSAVLFLACGGSGSDPSNGTSTGAGGMVASGGSTAARTPGTAVGGTPGTALGGTTGSGGETGATGGDATGGSGSGAGGTTPMCIPRWFAKSINVLVLGDANVTAMGTRGALWVGGNLTGVGYDVGADLPPDCSRCDLAVGGNIDLNGWLVLHDGATVYGGSLHLSGIQGAGCGVYAAAAAPMLMPNFAQIAADVKENSAYFAGLPANGTVNGTRLDGASAGSDLVVFDTTLCSFADVTIDVPADATAIVNSSCTNPSFVNGLTSLVMGGVAQPQCDAQQGTGGGCDHILFNFPNAATVTVNGMGAQGSILAPYAQFLGDAGNVAGEVVVDSMDTGVDFHAWFFEGCLKVTDGCGNSCTNSQACCASACLDVQTDAANCGSCGHVCPTDQTCNSGTCRSTEDAGTGGAPSGCTSVASLPETGSACRTDGESLCGNGYRCNCSSGIWGCYVGCPDVPPAHGTACPTGLFCSYYPYPPPPPVSRGGAACDCVESVWTCWTLD